MKKQQQYEESKYAKKAGGKLREEALKKANGNSKIESELEERLKELKEREEHK